MTENIKDAIYSTITGHFNELIKEGYCIENMDVKYLFNKQLNQIHFYDNETIYSSVINKSQKVNDYGYGVMGTEFCIIITNHLKYFRLGGWLFVENKSFGGATTFQELSNRAVKSNVHKTKARCKFSRSRVIKFDEQKNSYCI